MAAKRDDSSQVAVLCNRLALAVVETAGIVERKVTDGCEAAQESILNAIMRYHTDLSLAIAVLVENRATEARLRVLETQLTENRAIEARLRVVEAQLARRSADADLH